MDNLDPLSTIFNDDFEHAVSVPDDRLELSLTLIKEGDKDAFTKVKKKWCFCCCGAVV
jgi:hypothetical protein